MKNSNMDAIYYGEGTVANLGNKKYTLTFSNIPAGKYIFFGTFRVYGGGNYPDFISVSDTSSGDAQGGAFIKEWGFVSCPCRSIFIPDSNGKVVVYITDGTGSPNVTIRGLLVRIGN